MTPEQVPQSPRGYLRAAASHLCKREERETGRVHPGSPAAKVQSALSASERGTATEVEEEVGRIMDKKGLK